METVEALARTPGTLALGGREFVILPPTPRDALATAARMKDLARAKCSSPLEYVLRHPNLPPAGLALAVAEAIKLGAGGGVQPSDEVVYAEYTGLAGVRWMVWYHVSRVLKDFTLKDAEALVTEDTLFDAAQALDGALNFRAIDPNGPGPATGTAS